MTAMLETGRLFASMKAGFIDFDRTGLGAGDMSPAVALTSHFVEYIGNSINRARALRAGIVATDKGLASFDRDLEGLIARYQGLYSRFFTSSTPPVSQWDQEMEDAWRDDIVGPLLMWDRVECRERWGIPFVPPCKGPDLLLAMRLVDQAYAAAGFEIDTRDPFKHPVLALLASLEAFGQQMARDSREVFAAAGRKLVSAVAGAASAIVNATGGPLLWSGVALALLLLLIAVRK